MHGLIFVTWEKFLTEQFGAELLADYRTAIGETASTSPLANRIYSDETLLAGLGVACQLTGVSPDNMLYRYGRYFILNGLTSHLCSYLLNQIHGGRDLLLTMSSAHAQLQRSSAAITPPLFKYEAVSGKANELLLTYDSPRQLCRVLVGAIKGAAERFSEQVEIVEHTCMKRGYASCHFELRFFSMRQKGTIDPPPANFEDKRALADLVLKLLPEQDGVTLAEVRDLLQSCWVPDQYMRPYRILEALRMLEHVGLASSSTNQPGDTLMYRRYWRASISDNQDRMRVHLGQRYSGSLKS
jgi:hypothetical protein